MRATLLALAILASSAAAQVPIGPFTGQYQEEFDGPQVLFTQCMPSGVFSATATMCTPGYSGCHTTGGWGYVCFIPNHQSGWMFGSASGAVEFTFNTPASKFGGYFGTNCGVPDANFDFYDASNNLLLSTLVSVPADCQWYWRGWQFPVACSRIVVTGMVSAGGYVLMDSLEVDYGPTGPTNYCTAGTTTSGCNASISATSNPDVAHYNACQINVSNVEGQKSGIIFYGLSQNTLPWCSSGGSSFLCVKPPTQRTATQSSGGTAGACDGTLALDWNAFQLANPGALGQPWSAGNTAEVQAWFRDPPACKTTSLSDALELTYQP